MTVLKIAAFSDGENGGNPAGVVIANQLPADAEMQRIAADVGFSETAFAAPAGSGWRVRYFSPESEVPFCGHATIALGAALALKNGDGVFQLTLNEAEITVEGRLDGRVVSAALQSPPTRSKGAPAPLVSDALALIRIHLGSTRLEDSTCHCSWRCRPSDSGTSNPPGTGGDDVRSGRRTNSDEA